MKHRPIAIRTQVYLLLPFLILLFNNAWVISWIIAASIHEFFHLLSIRLLKINVLSFEIGIFGAKIETEPISNRKELIIALSGPIGALLTLAFACYIPKIALCAMAQSAYNLLPVYPLDGGRAVRSLFITRIKKEHMMFLEKCVLYSIIIGVLLVSIALNLGVIPLVIAISLFIKYRNANIPCKP